LLGRCEQHAGDYEGNELVAERRIAHSLEATLVLGGTLAAQGRTGNR
jgi:hypothetical protein